MSHISQFGLFLFTIGTIYFTVIPLYQKALLDEKIAEKEIKLDKMQETLDSFYKKVRLNALSRFIVSAGAECSGLTAPVPSFQNMGQPMGPSHDQLVLAIEPADCLTNFLVSTTPLRELSNSDRATLEASVKRLAVDLEALRQAALARHARAESTVDSDPSRSDPASVKPGSVADFVFRGQSLEFQRDVLRRAAIDKERSDAAHDYGAQVRDKVSELRSIKWPHNAASDL